MLLDIATGGLLAAGAVGVVMGFVLLDSEGQRKPAARWVRGHGAVGVAATGLLAAALVTGPARGVATGSESFGAIALVLLALTVPAGTHRSASDRRRAEARRTDRRGARNPRHLRPFAPGRLRRAGVRTGRRPPHRMKSDMMASPISRRVMTPITRSGRGTPRPCTTSATLRVRLPMRCITACRKSSSRTTM